MINSIIESIIVSLQEEFGDTVQSYREEGLQEFQKPCFLVRNVSHSCRLFLGKRYFRKNQFCIQFFPDTKEKENEVYNDAAKRLTSCLEYLKADDGLVRGTNMKYEITEGILHFFVNYDMFVYRLAADVPVMEEIASETSVKG